MESLIDGPDFFRSIGVWTVISEFLSTRKLLELQLVNKKYFYSRLVPSVMWDRRIFAVIDQLEHLFIKNKTLYGIKVSSSTVTEEIDFEEDNWIHDFQHQIQYNRCLTKPQRLFAFSELGEGAADEELRIQSDEEVHV